MGKKILPAQRAAGTSDSAGIPCFPASVEDVRTLWMSLSAQKPCFSGKKPSTKEGLLFIIDSKRPYLGFAMESDTSFMICAPVNTASRDPGERYFTFQCCWQQTACLRRDSGRKATHASAHKMQMNGGRVRDNYSQTRIK